MTVQDRPQLDIKICGLKSEQAVEAVLQQGATHLGYIFFPKSPRHVTTHTAKELADQARGQAQNVAVTVDADDQYLDEIVEVMRPDMLQLHGNEAPERVAIIRKRYGLPVIKAFSVREAADFLSVRDYIDIADRFIFDAKAPKNALLPGGNGVSFDWHLLSNLDEDIDYMLSGGLNVQNIAQALMLTHARGIDISSGVEIAPGEKDIRLIKEFFETVRNTQALMSAKENNDGGTDQPAPSSK